MIGGTEGGEHASSGGVATLRATECLVRNSRVKIGREKEGSRVPGM